METNTLNDGFGLSRTRRTLPMALLRAREAVMDRFRPILAAHDFSEQQWRVLRVLNEAETLDATNLAAKANVLMPSLTRILKLLSGRGLIELRRDPADKRRTLITLTGAGHDAIGKVAPRSIDVYESIEAAYGHDRMARLLDELDELTKIVAKLK